MTTKATLIVGAALVAAFFLGWLVKPEPKTSGYGARAGGQGGMIARASYDRVQRELEIERKQRVELERALEDLKAPAKGPDAQTDSKPKKPQADVGGGPRFHYDKYRDALKQVDWKVVGESLHAMPPLLEELFDALKNDKPLPPSVGQIQRHNGPLLEQAMKMQQAGLPGTTVNAVFTHPVAQVNMIYVTLRQAGKSLSEDQEERLGDIGARFMELDSQRLAAYEPTTMGLQKLIDETALKDRFYADVDAILSAGQRQVLHPPATAGYTGADLFSSGLVWAPMARPLGFSTREDLEAKMLSQFSARLKLDDASRTLAKAAVGAWSQSMPDSYLAAPVTAIVRKRIIKVSRVRSAAYAQLKLQHALMTQLQLDDAQHTSLRQNTRVFVPFRMVGDGGG